MHFALAKLLSGVSAYNSLLLRPAGTWFLSIASVHECLYVCVCVFVCVCVSAPEAINN